MTSKPPVGGISVVTLIRTDTTLDHSQKAEKVCSFVPFQDRLTKPAPGTPFISSKNSKNDQESRRLRGLQANFYCLLKPTIPPLSTSSDFACSVSSLGRCSLHYPPGGPKLPLKSPCRMRPWTGMDYQRSRCRNHSRRTYPPLILLPRG